jgi:molecular chaperone Hsp33
VHSAPDVLQRFVFERARVRGELVRLDHTWQEILRRHPYPEVLRETLGELLAACALLAATLKFEGGALVLQIQGGDPVSLLVVECSSELTLRATATWEGDLDWLGGGATLRGLAAGGRCALTIDPGPGMQAYQGIVPLEGASVARVLEHYMQRSEQIETRFHLAADARRAAGLLLQKLPDSGGRPGAPDEDPELWADTARVAAGLTPGELLGLPADALLRRVFHHEDLRLFESMEVGFGCRCSRERVSGVLRMLGRDEVIGLLQERGEVEVRCEFCAERYVFDPRDAEAALADPRGEMPPLARIG